MPAIAITAGLLSYWVNWNWVSAYQAQYYQLVNNHIKLLQNYFYYDKLYYYVYNIVTQLFRYQFVYWKHFEAELDAYSDTPIIQEVSNFIYQADIYIYNELILTDVSTRFKRGLFCLSLWEFSRLYDFLHIRVVYYNMNHLGSAHSSMTVVTQSYDPAQVSGQCRLNTLLKLR